MRLNSVCGTRGPLFQKGDVRMDDSVSVPKIQDSGLWRRTSCLISKLIDSAGQKIHDHQVTGQTVRRTVDVLIICVPCIMTSSSANPVVTCGTADEVRSPDPVINNDMTVEMQYQAQMGYMQVVVLQNQGQERVRNSAECNEFATRDDVQRSHQQDNSARSWGCRQERNSTVRNSLLTAVSVDCQHTSRSIGQSCRIVADSHGRSDVQERQVENITEEGKSRCETSRWIDGEGRRRGDRDEWKICVTNCDTTHATIGAYGRQHKDMVSFVQDQNQARRERTGETPSSRRNQSICGIGRAVPDDHAALRHTTEKLLLSDHKNRKRTIWHCRTGGWCHTQKYLFGTREVWTWMAKDALGSGAEIAPHHVRKTAHRQTGKTKRYLSVVAVEALTSGHNSEEVTRKSPQWKEAQTIFLEETSRFRRPIRFTPLRRTLKGSCRFRSIVMPTDAVFWTNDGTARQRRVHF